MNIPIEFVRELFEYDKETGIVRLRINHGAKKAGQIAGNRGGKTGVRKVCIYGCEYPEHKIAIMLVTGRWPHRDVKVKHINGILSDNRWENLRFADESRTKEDL